MKAETKVVSSTALLAAAAAAASSQSAMAADLGPVPVAAPTWQGFYVGGHVGASWLSSVSDDSGYSLSSYAGAYSLITPGTANTATAIGIIGGPQIGYNFQARNFVFGAEADFSFLGNSSATSHGNRQATITYNYGPGPFPFGSNVSTTRTSSIDQMATFRVRFGLDFDGTMPFVTGGLALANIKNTYTSFAVNAYGSTSLVSTSSTTWTPGLALGAGVEHQFGSHWSVRGEILWVGFEDQTLSVSDFAGFGNPAGTVKFTNSLIIGQLGMNYRF
jgi:outer membrane immunogenic protein